MSTDGAKAANSSTDSAHSSAYSQAAPGDGRLLSAEIRASIAYAEALVGPGILTADERDNLIQGLKQVETNLNTLPRGADLFDAVDDGLAAAVGAVAGKLNAGRSRIERVMTTLRLWLLDEMELMTELVADIQRALIQQAEGHVGALMPGYTHFQPTQVVSCAHWLLSYFWMLARDQDRLAAAIARASISPLGSGLLAGTPHRIDRRALAAALGFSDASANSMDAVSDMDFAAEFLFIASMLGVHLSRLAEDLILYSNPALGFVTLDAKYTARPALMPHQRNPEAVELARGKAGKLLGELAGFLSTIKSLPSTYNHDTQENRQTLFDAVDSLTSLLTTMSGVVETLTIHADQMLDALDERMTVSDLADYLVVRGVAYREAHTIIARLVEKANQSNMPISELELASFQAESPAFDADVFAIFDYSRSAAQRATIGGTAPAAIRAQIRAALDWLVEAGLE